jgi:hypothetical protein
VSNSRIVQWAQRTHWTDVTRMPGAIVAGVASGVICTLFITGLRYLLF